MRVEINFKINNANVKKPTSFNAKPNNLRTLEQNLKARAFPLVAVQYEKGNIFILLKGSDYGWGRLKIFMTKFAVEQLGTNLA